MIQLLQTIIAILIFLFGASLFSFLNVVIYRVPRKISFVGGHSFCPDCRHTLGAPDMFPVLSYLFLRGKCRYCKAHISLRYPLVEILGGLSSLLCMAVYIDWEGDLWKGFLRFLTAFALLADVYKRQVRCRHRSLPSEICPPARTGLLWARKMQENISGCGCAAHLTGR